MLKHQFQHQSSLLSSNRMMMSVSKSIRINLGKSSSSMTDDPTATISFIYPTYLYPSPRPTNEWCWMIFSNLFLFVCGSAITPLFHHVGNPSLLLGPIFVHSKRLTESLRQRRESENVVYIFCHSVSMLSWEFDNGFMRNRNWGT